MTWVLALDTSTDWVTAGIAHVGDDGQLTSVVERSVEHGRAHGELLASHIRAALVDSERRPTDLKAVVVGVGPGPFTGLRVGIVTAATVAELVGAPVYPVCSLDAIAAQISARPLLVVTDARRREVYWARYDRTGRVAGPGVAAPSTLDAGRATVAGEGTQRYPQLFLGSRQDIGHPTVRGLLQCAQARVIAGAPGEQPTPMYLRRPDAVEPAPRTSRQ